MSLIFWRHSQETKTKDVSDQHPLPVKEHGRQTPDIFIDDSAAASTTAKNLAALLTLPATPCRQVLVQNDPDNTVDIFVGTENSQTMQLRPGEAETILIDNIIKVFVKSASATPTVNVHISAYSEDV